MNRLHHQLQNTLNALSEYREISRTNRQLPLKKFLAAYFRAHRQMGSSDRKSTSRLLYDFFRLGAVLHDADIKSRMAIAAFICEKESFTLLEYLLGECSLLSPGHLNLSLEEKLVLAKQSYPGFDIHDLFPFKPDFSDGVNQEKFYRSFFAQPKLWVRLRRQADNEQLLSFWKEQHIPFEVYADYPYAVSFDNRTSLDAWRDKGYFEIQDLSSQLTGAFFHPQDGDHWWDCCAGSGGKSLLLWEANPDIRLLVSDNRSSILKNLSERFSNAKIKNYSLQQLDLSKGNCILEPSLRFDGILADVPCSGSGTWARTPEMIVQTDASFIHAFQQQQISMAHAVIPYLKKGKPLVYITCSVFREENEEVVRALADQYGMQVEEMAMITGYDKGADNLFVARLLK